tara:strand:+ start:358 stop:474 length:117 start_codon:yes stop_codon:yes gene_type:complete
LRSQHFINHFKNNSSIIFIAAAGLLLGFDVDLSFGIKF